MPSNLIGFVLINGFTFCVDLALLTVLRSWVQLPLWLAITIAYCSAFALSYVLNRAFNFRSHAPVGPQLVKYAVIVAVNYFVLILGLGTGLSALGVEYHLARIAAGLCEGVFMYCALRWIVFWGSGRGLGPGGAGREPRADTAESEGPDRITAL